ncbi:MAG: transglutaminase family protein [Planctomycetota bacterium]
MRYLITHHTEYTFSRPVALEPHLLRFQPRSEGAQFVSTHEIEISPAPSGSTAHLDAEGNSVNRVWFQGESAQLILEARSMVQTTRTNPFDYLLTDKNASLPVKYRLELQPILLAAQRRSRLPTASDPVATLARQLANQVDQQLTRFLMSLSQHVRDHWEIIRREEGPPWSPEQTFERKAGACRDLAWLFVDACRSVGLAARFVSGYQADPDEKLRRDLHGWAEVYVPGAGWRGFDPTQGLAVADAHIAVAASIDPAGTYPVAGSFRGTGATSTMTTNIEIELQTESPEQHP